MMRRVGDTGATTPRAAAISGKVSVQPQLAKRASGARYRRVSVHGAGLRAAGERVVWCAPCSIALGRTRHC